MFPVLIIACARPGLLYVNGAFCGELTEEQIFPVRPDGRVYVEYRALSEPAFPLAVALDLKDGQVQPGFPLSAYAVQWPDRVIELELRPMLLPQAPVARELLATLPYGDAGLSHQRFGEEEMICLAEEPLFTLPDGAHDLRVQSVPGGALVLAAEAAGESAWLLANTPSGGMTLAGRVRGERIALEGEGKLLVLASAGDDVGHGHQIQYQITSGRLQQGSKERVWLPGAPRWPQTPQETLRAYLNAMRLGTVEEAAAFLTPQAISMLASSPLPAFDAVVALRRPLVAAPGDHPLAMGVLSRQAPNQGRVSAICARAVASRHAQGAYQLESVVVDPMQK